MKNITKKEFLSVQSKFPPSKWIKFGFKYFSKEGENKKVKKFITILLGVLFVFFMVAGFINIPTSSLIIPIIIYSGIIFGLALYMLSVVLLNNHRLNKIRKELGISKEEYDILVKKYN
jgi:Flp pilus assembly protein TadB